MSGVSTAHSIRREELEENVIEGLQGIDDGSRESGRASMVGRALDMWSPNESAWKSDDGEYELYASLATRVYSAQGRIADIVDWFKRFHYPNTMLFGKVTDTQQSCMLGSRL